MPTYKYRAKKGPGDIVDGIVEANSKSEAIDRVSQMGYFPIRIEEATAENIQRQGNVSKKRIGRVRTREITIFTRQLAGLLRTGIPILNALNIITEQTENANLKEILYNIHESVKGGENFSSALAQYPKVFSVLYVAMVKAGEDSGHLPEILMRISDYREKEDEMFSRIRMALAYPALMAIVGTGTVIFMLVFVMPRLMGMFAGLGQSLPLPTQILIFISAALRKGWYYIVIFIFLAAYLIRMQSKTKAGKLYFSAIALGVPLFGKLSLKAELARFSRTLALLVESGIPILKALEISIPVVGNGIIKIQLTHSYKELEQGGSFGKSLKASGRFPPFMTNLITVGEESGKLADALIEISNSYEKDTDEAMKIMASLLEPLMILVMGLIVGFMVIAMLLPIFEINIAVK